MHAYPLTLVLYHLRTVIFRANCLACVRLVLLVGRPDGRDMRTVEQLASLLVGARCLRTVPYASVETMKCTWQPRVHACQVPRGFLRAAFRHWAFGAGALAFGLLASWVTTGIISQVYELPAGLSGGGIDG